MKSIQLKLIFTILIMLSVSSVFAQHCKQKVTKNITTWYENNPEKYTLSIPGKEATAAITRYHPNRADEKNDLIEISYEGMKITLKFDQPLDKITTHKDSLQKYFSYVSIVRIYNEIPTKGWTIYPRTPKVLCAERALLLPLVAIH